MNPPRTHVVRLGNPDWPRFAIQRGKHRYWTGKAWSHDPGDALLYHDEEETTSQAMVLHDSIRPRRFVATALIAVDHDEPFTVKDFQRVVEQSAVTLIVPEHQKHVDIYITLDWNGFEEIK